MKHCKFRNNIYLFFRDRTEQQKNSCLAEMNDMRAAVEEMNMEKVYQSLFSLINVIIKLKIIDTKDI